MGHVTRLSYGVPNEAIDDADLAATQAVAGQLINDAVLPQLNNVDQATDLPADVVRQADPPLNDVGPLGTTVGMDAGPTLSDKASTVVEPVGQEIHDADGGHAMATDPQITDSDQHSDPDITSTSDSSTSVSSSDNGLKIVVLGHKEAARHDGGDEGDSMEVETHPGSRKRELSARNSSDSSSDDSSAHHRKKGKAIQAALSRLCDSPISLMP